MTLMIQILQMKRYNKENWIYKNYKPKIKCKLILKESNHQKKQNYCRNNLINLEFKWKKIFKKV